MNLAEIADLAAIAQAGHDEAERLLAVLERRRVEPQVMAVALMFAAGTLIGRLAPDAEALQTMIRHCAPSWSTTRWTIFANYNNNDEAINDRGNSRAAPLASDADRWFHVEPPAA